ncbi:uncharacterized protein LTR77_005891 [Saxophila tyrrhenica]|uniref:Uncharacterized protein n=1 Tax=Saxophila tyrrhenica TaxID=1690608 RepID=A0AAV9P9U7_9PEZI|nr:hypothetical protein LTR77_005891 [Saxophila tyrrhenica]
MMGNKSQATITAAVQSLAVAICTAVLLLFVALTHSRITLPEYTASYAQKDIQQVLNLLVTVVATVIGILLSHCRRATNEAETRSELQNDELTIPRLHVHAAAAGSQVRGPFHKAAST